MIYLLNHVTAVILTSACDIFIIIIKYYTIPCNLEYKQSINIPHLYLQENVASYVTTDFNVSM